MSTLRTANLLGALALAVADRLEAALKAHPGRNDSAAAALCLIATYEGCSNVELARSLKLSHPATVRLIDRLEAAGLVEVRSGADLRANAFFLTGGGRARTAELLKARCAVLEDVTTALSAEQMAQLDGIAETLLTALTTSPQEGAHICRLCDDVACPEDRCPVHTRAAALMAA